MEEARSLVVTAYLVERPVDVGVIGVPLDRCSIGGWVCVDFVCLEGLMDWNERADMEEWCVSLDGTQDDCSERDDWVRVCQYPRVQRKLGARLA